MGNAVEASKLPHQTNLPEEIPTLAQPTKVKKVEEEQEWVEFFSGEHDPNLGQLCGCKNLKINA